MQPMVEADNPTEGGSASLANDILKDDPIVETPAETPAAPVTPAETPAAPAAPVDDTPPAPPNGGAPTTPEPQKEDPNNPGFDMEGNEMKPAEPAAPSAPVTPAPVVPAAPAAPVTPDPVTTVKKVTDGIAELRAGKIPEGGMTEFHKAVQLASQTPLIFPEKLPRREDFTMEDGTFDLDNYMKQYTNSIIMGIQKSITGGPLAAATYGILMEAMKEEGNTLKEDSAREAYANDIMGKLNTAFPRLATDKVFQELVDDTLNGVMLKRQRLIDAGEKLGPMKYEEYEAVVARLIGSGPKPAGGGTPVDPIEPPNGGGVALNPGGGDAALIDQDDADISAMQRVKSKSLF